MNFFPIVSFFYKKTNYLSAIIASMNIIFYREKIQIHGVAWAYALYKLNEKGVLLYYFLHNTIIHCNIVFLIPFFFLICFFSI